MFQLSHLVRATQRPRGARVSTCEVALVGCGVPKRGMGCVATRRSTLADLAECLPLRSWYHGVQMIDGRVPSGRLTDVVEPWFLGAGADSDAGKEFKAWVMTACRWYSIRLSRACAGQPVQSSP